MVYILTLNPFPNGMAATNRITSYAKGISENGLACKILILKRTEVYNNIRNHKLSGNIDNYSFKYISNSTIRSKYRIIRLILDYIDYLHSIFYIINNVKNNDVVFFYGTSIKFEKAILSISKIIGYKTIRELCEYPFASNTQTSRIKRKTNYVFMNLFPKYDAFISISHSLYYLAEQYKSNNSKNLLIPILVDKSRFCVMVQDVKHIEEPYIFHCGTLTQTKDNIIETLEAFALSVNEIPFTIKYIFAGEYEHSPIKQDIDKVIRNNNLDNNVIFLGVLPYNEVLSWLCGCNLVVLNKNTTIQNQYGFSTKLGEYLMAGKPVITTTVGDAKYYLINNESAYIVEPDNAKLISHAIVYAFMNEIKSNIIGRRGREIAECTFDYKINGEKIVKFISSFYQKS